MVGSAQSGRLGWRQKRWRAISISSVVDGASFVGAWVGFRVARGSYCTVHYKRL